MGVEVKVIDLTLGVIKTIWVCFPVENRGLVKPLKRLPDFVRFINEIKCEGVCLTRCGSVETRKGLNTLNTPFLSTYIDWMRGSSNPVWNLFATTRDDTWGSLVREGRYPRDLDWLHPDSVNFSPSIDTYQRNQRDICRSSLVLRVVCWSRWSTKHSVFDWVTIIPRDRPLISFDPLLISGPTWSNLISDGHLMRIDIPD